MTGQKTKFKREKSTDLAGLVERMITVGIVVLVVIALIALLDSRKG